MKIELDRELCISSGSCTLAAPGLFARDEDGVVVALEENPPDKLGTSAREAEAACPVAVIRVLD